MTNLQVGVKVLLADGKGKFLLLKRSKEKYADVTELWDIVGGRIDPGRSLMENLQREVVEEAGLEIVGDPMLIAAQDIMHGDFHVVRLTYIARASSTKVELSDEHVDYRWLTPAELAVLPKLDSNFVKILSKGLEAAHENGFSGGFTSNIGKIDDVENTANIESEEVKRKEAEDMEEKDSAKSNGPKIVDEIFVNLGKKGEDVEDDSKVQSPSGVVNRLKKGTNEIGRLGEDIAGRYLEDRGYKIVERNYRKKWGEIDIVAKKSNSLHFVEVKAGISRETGGYRPEEHVHSKKLERLHRTIQSYLVEHKQEDVDWQLDVLAVDLSQENKTARCRFLENIV